MTSLSSYFLPLDQDQEVTMYYDSLADVHFENMETYLDDLGLTGEEREDLKQILLKENQ